MKEYGWLTLLAYACCKIDRRHSIIIQDPSPCSSLTLHPNLTECLALSSTTHHHWIDEENFHFTHHATYIFMPTIERTVFTHGAHNPPHYVSLASFLTSSDDGVQILAFPSRSTIDVISIKITSCQTY